MSVWTGVEALKAYICRRSHAYVFRRRKDRFEESDAPSLALWWVPAGTVPTSEEGKRRFEQLALNGPTADVFTFRQTFPSP